ncbi:MAG TPA: response regulator [Planctomycetota bacterium]|nr:response regulator [Planctomycetota bacterium]
MKKVVGDLEVFGIANLLQMLSSAECHGFLTISKGDDKKVIHFSPGGIRLVRGVRRTNPLGEILVRNGTLTRDRLAKLLEEQQRSGKRLGDLVIEEGILSCNTLDAALREQVAEEIYDLFTWSDSTFEFVESMEDPSAEDPGPLADVALDANVMSIMIEASRRMDELERIRAVIPDYRLVPQQVQLPVSIDDLELDRNAVEEILPLVDGVRSIDRIIEESLHPKFTVLRTLYGLTERGILKIRDKRELQGPVTILGRAPRPGGPGSPGRTILLLSELGTFRAAIAWYLKNAGYVVLEGNGWDASAQALCQERADAIVFDVSIESDDALAACQLIKKASKKPLILLSSNSSAKALSNARQSGATYVFVKPLKETLLVERLSELFASSAK